MLGSTSFHILASYYSPLKTALGLPLDWSFMSRKIKTDFILALSLIVLCILLSFYNWSNTEFKSTDLTGADLSCDRDRVNYQGYFTLGNITYYSSERYETCNHFYQQMQGKNLYGTYFASNNRLTTLYVDGVLENYYSMGMVIGWGLMMAFVSFLLLRIPVKWIFGA